ncbi:MAG TPA: hypothetical protein DDY20_02070 [Desulfobulbaceae bacterium]|nr:hypothetical protein [Desulfobulbaceae bacterium]
MRYIDKGREDARGIKLVIYIIKILYFNHSTSCLSNNFVRIAFYVIPTPANHEICLNHSGG